MSEDTSDDFVGAPRLCEHALIADLTAKLETALFKITLVEAERDVFAAKLKAALKSASTEMDAHMETIARAEKAEAELTRANEVGGAAIRALQGEAEKAEAKTGEVCSIAGLLEEDNAKLKAERDEARALNNDWVRRVREGSDMIALRERVRVLEEQAGIDQGWAVAASARIEELEARIEDCAYLIVSHARGECTCETDEECRTAIFEQSNALLDAEGE